MSDQTAFQEIDEAVRQDNLKAWWTRWGSWVVGGAVLVVVGAVAIVGWRQYDNSQRAGYSMAYSVALSRIGQDNAAARAELDRQAATAPEPYRSLAALAAAQLRDKPEEQVAALEAVAPQLPRELSDLALVMAAFRSVDAGRADEVLAKLEPLTGADRAFRVSVRELQAMAAQRKGDAKRAREIWTEISRDPAAPQGSLQRAQAMLTLFPAEAK